MLAVSDLRPYQHKCVEHIISNPGAGLFVGMGLGKTVSSLTAIQALITDYMEVSKVLVIAPKRVAETVWHSEAASWQHLSELRVERIIGNAKQRIKSLRADADVYVIGRDNVPWLVKYLNNTWPFDMVVIDELSSFKSPQSMRFKALRKVIPLSKRVVGLTGTPVASGYIGLWSQIYLLDQGSRLGKFYTHYRDNYFDYNMYTRAITIKKGARRRINRKIEDICISMKGEDFLTLPDRLDQDVWIDLPDNIMQQYKAFERDMVMEINNEDIMAINAAALTVKLRQFSNGFIYGADKSVNIIHDAKLDALSDEIEAALVESPVLLFYQFQSDLNRIFERLKIYDPVLLRGEDEINAWNAGNIRVLVTHAKSAGHGLNLQYGGNRSIWFGMDWSVEDWDQANARLRRPGQQSVVINRRLLCRGTIDEKVVRCVEHGLSVQDSMIEALKAIIDENN